MKPYNFRKRLMAATPIMCLIIFLLLGTIWDLWHPGWMVFFLIPVMPFLIGYKKIHLTYPLFCAIAYLIMGLGFGLWHPGWIIFLTIPVFEIFASGVKVKKNHKDNDYDDDEIIIDIK